MNNNVIQRIGYLRSVKWQFTLIFILLMTGVFTLGWVINNRFLEKYYIMEKEKALRLAYAEINAAATNGSISSDDFAIEFYKTSAKYNIDMVVMDLSANAIKDTSNQDNLRIMLLNNMAKLFQGEELGEVEERNENYILQYTTDPRSRLENIVMWGFLDNGNPFLLLTAIESIRNSVLISNRFLAYVAISSFLLGSIIVHIVSGFISHPIMELAKISERVSRLDFEARYEGHHKNELDILGQSVNVMSETLKQKISELKTANNELMRDIEHRTRIDEMRKEFLSNVSHEMKTPIALIQGYAEGLIEGVNDDIDSRNTYCEVIVDEAEKMNAMLQKLLTLNRLEFGSDAPQLERFDITDVIRGAVAPVEILAKQQGYQINFDCGEQIYVWGDELEIDEVLRNYITNAINHCDGKKPIAINIETSERKAIIRVFNSGKNIPEESLPYIWDKFYKVDKARTREYGGSGIGLSIVKAIMESVNQRYGVINYSDGVEFWFELDRE